MKTNTKHKMFALMMCMLMLIVAFVCISLANPATIAYASEMPESTGEGTESDPRMVYNYAQLKDALESGSVTCVKFGAEINDVVEEGQTAISINGTKDLELYAGYGSGRITGNSTMKSLFLVEEGDDFKISYPLNSTYYFEPKADNASMIKMTGGKTTVKYLTLRVFASEDMTASTIDVSGGELHLNRANISARKNDDSAVAIGLKISATEKNAINLFDDGNTSYFIESAILPAGKTFADYNISETHKVIEDGDSYCITNEKQAIIVHEGKAYLNGEVVTHAYPYETVTIVADNAETFAEWDYEGDTVYFADRKASTTTVKMELRTAEVFLFKKLSEVDITFPTIAYGTVPPVIDLTSYFASKQLDNDTTAVWQKKVEYHWEDMLVGESFQEGNQYRLYLDLIGFNGIGGYKVDDDIVYSVTDGSGEKHSYTIPEYDYKDRFSFYSPSELLYSNDFSIPSATVGSEFGKKLYAYGGSDDYTFSLGEGAPAWLTINEHAYLNGTRPATAQDATTIEIITTDNQSGHTFSRTIDVGAVLAPIDEISLDTPILEYGSVLSAISLPTGDMYADISASCINYSNNTEFPVNLGDIIEKDIENNYRIEYSFELASGYEFDDSVSINIDGKTFVAERLSDTVIEFVYYPESLFEIIDSADLDIPTGKIDVRSSVNFKDYIVGGCAPYTLTTTTAPDGVSINGTYIDDDKTSVRPQSSMQVVVTDSVGNVASVDIMLGEVYDPNETDYALLGIGTGWRSLAEWYYLDRDTDGDLSNDVKGGDSDGKENVGKTLPEGLSWNGETLTLTMTNFSGTIPMYFSDNHVNIHLVGANSIIISEAKSTVLGSSSNASCLYFDKGAKFTAESGASLKIYYNNASTLKCAVRSDKGNLEFASGSYDFRIASSDGGTIETANTIYGKGIVYNDNKDIIISGTATMNVQGASASLTTMAGICTEMSDILISTSNIVTIECEMRGTYYGADPLRKGASGTISISGTGTYTFTAKGHEIEEDSRYVYNQEWDTDFTQYKIDKTCTKYIVDEVELNNQTTIYTSFASLEQLATPDLEAFGTDKERKMLITGLDKTKSYSYMTTYLENYAASSWKTIDDIQDDGTAEIYVDFKGDRNDLILHIKVNGDYVSTRDSQNLQIYVTRPVGIPYGTLSHINATDGANGKILGVDETMEWTDDVTGDWTEVTGTEISGLAQGTYYVRYKAGKNMVCPADDQDPAIGYTTIEISNKLMQTVSFAIKDKTLDEHNKYTAKYGEKLTVLFTGGDTSATPVIAVASGNATYSNGIITLTGTGDVVVRATKAGNDTYDSVTVNLTISVSKADVTVTAPTGLTATYGDTLADVTLPSGFTAKFGETDIAGSLSWKVSSTSVGDAGNNSFTAVFTPNDDEKYNSKEFNIVVAVDTAQFDLSSVDWDYTSAFTYAKDTERTVELSGLPSGVTATYTNNSATDAGTYTASVEFDYDDSNCELINNNIADLSWTIDKATQTIDISGVESDYTYSGELQTIDSGASVADTEQTLVYSNNTFTTVSEGNNMTVTVSVVESANYLANSTTFDITVAKLAFDKPTADTTVFVYTGEEQTYVPVGFDSDTMTITGNKQTGAGDYTVSVALIDSANNDWTLGGSLSYTFTIEKLKIDKTTSDTTVFVYTGEEQTYEPVGFDSDTMTITGNKQTGAGDYTVVVELKDSDNYDWNIGGSLTFTFKIERAELVKPTVDTSVFVYTGEEQTYEPVGFDSDTMNITDNATETNADTYNVKVSLKDNDNYLWTDYTYGDISFSFTIQRAEPDYVVPSLMATVGQVIGEVAMPDNFSLREDIVGTDSVGTVGSGATIYLTYTPDDPDNYLVVEDIEVTLTIVESLADVKTAKIAEIDALDDTLVEADYTVASWTAFQNAITADKTAVTAKASIAEINAYDVTARVSALVTIQSVVDDFADDNSTALALTTSTVAIADKTAINTAISAYNALAEEVKAELAAEKTLLDSLLGKIAELEAELALAEAKTDAKAELDIYVDSNDYRSAEQATLATAIADGKTAIDNSADTSAVSVALANAKTAINAIKTDAEYQVEEVATALAEAKTDAKAELDLYADSNDYRSAEQATLATAIADGKTAIDNSADIVLLDIALANAKTEIDEIKTDAEYQVEEVATATALANAKTAKIAEINALMATFSQSDYRAEEWAEIEDTFASAIASVNASSSLLSLGTAVDLVSLQSSVEEVLTDSEKTAEENNPAPPEVEEGDDPASTDDENGLALGLGLGLGLPLALGVVMLLLLFLNKFGVLGLGFVDKQKWLKFFHNSKK